MTQFALPATKTCVYCGTKEQYQTVHKGTYMEKDVFNFQAGIKGMDVCNRCGELVAKESAKRNRRIRRLGLIGKPISHPAWGKFFEERKS